MNVQKTKKNLKKLRRPFEQVKNEQIRKRLNYLCFKGQADTHYRGKRHARITEIRRRKSQKTESSKLDSDGNQTATESSGHFSESDNLNQGEMATENTVVAALDHPSTMVPKDIKSEVS